MNVSTLELKISWDKDKYECDLPVGAKILPIATGDSSCFPLISFIDSNNEEKERYVFATESAADETYDSAVTVIDISVSVEQDYLNNIRDVKSSLRTSHIFYKKA